MAQRNSVSPQSPLSEDILLSLLAEGIEVVAWFAQATPERVIYVTPAFERMWGVSADELYEDSTIWINSILPEDRGLAQQAFYSWVSGESSSFEVNFRIRRRTDGEIRWISDRGAFIRRYNGMMVLGGLAEDITERRILEQERAELLSRIQEALQARDEFISLASHELRTPLVPLKLSIQTIATSLSRLNVDDGSATTHAMLVRLAGIAIEQLRRMELLTNNLLDASHLETKSFEIRRVDLSLSALVRKVVETHRQWIESSGASVVLDLEEGVRGRFDSMRVEQVLVNLLGNALKYANGTAIEITLRQLNGAASLSVRDHGPGVPDSLKNSIFDRYSRGPGASGVAGFGLGLYICRRIAEAHGGRIEVQDAPGGGARFELLLPVTERMTQAA